MLNRLALLSVHTSPLAQLGGNKTGGMNVYIRELAQELGRRGVTVDIYTRKAAAHLPLVDHTLGPNVRVICILAGPEMPLNPDDVYAHLPQFTAGVLAFTTSEGLRYDLLYSHYWLSGLVAHQLKDIWGTPFVQMFHTLGHMKNRIVPDGILQLAPDVRVHYETQITGWANRIVAATPAEQAQLLWLYRTDRRKIVVIPPGVNTERFHVISMANAKQKLGIPVERQLLLFAGRIEPLKGVDSILQALHLIQQRNPTLLHHVRFVVVGGDITSTHDRELVRLRQLSEQLGLGQAVDFVGAKDQTLLPFYYAAAAAVIMPSDYESFGLVALEAMACGTPVIASQVGGLPFLIREGETGFLVPVREPAALADRMLTLLLNPPQRLQMGAAAAKLAQQYSWSAIADQLIPLFEDLIAHPCLIRHKN